MADIKHEEDIAFVFEEMINRAIIPSEVIQPLKENVLAIVTHPELNHFFEPSEKVINERDIITSTGAILRPDRLNLNDDNSITVVLLQKELLLYLSFLQKQMLYLLHV